MRGTSILIILGLGLSQAGGQTVINGGRRIKGAWDASGALSTKPVKTGTALPATCSVGEEFFKTDAPAGQNQYGCTSTNTWTPLGAGSTITNLNQIPTRSYADLQNVPATFPPAAHKATHAMGGSDALAPADIGAESTAMKGTPNGYAALDANGLVPAAQLPAAQLGGTAVFAPVLSSNTFGAAAVANKLVCGGIVAPVQVVFSAITYGVQTADATGTYDFGIYDGTAGPGGTATLKCSIGSRVLPSTGTTLTANCSQGGTITLNPGRHYVCLTGTASTGKMYASTYPTFYGLSASFGITTGGALPASFTIPADVWSVASSAWVFLLH